MPSRKSGKQVLMLATSPKTRGGISSVIRIYEQAGLLARWPVSYLPTHTDSSFFDKVLISVKACFVYVGWLIRRRDLILHVHSASRASFWRKSVFMLPAIFLDLPIIFHLHGGEFSRFYWDECGALRKSFIRFVLDRCARLVVLSERSRRELAAITVNPEIHIVVNPGLPILRNSSTTVRENATLLYLGRLCRAKGIYPLLNALSQIVTKYPEVRLVCCGDGALAAAEKKVIELGIGANVEFVGWIGQERREKLLATATMLVLPSFAEGMPMSILEAMSAGLPIVATGVGGIPEMISDGVEGLLVPPGDSKSLQKAILRLMDEAELRDAIGARGREKFDACFNVNVVLPRIETIYRSLGVLPTGSS